ncbi:hypothetical protein BU23DRAFT_432125, partial [Bimuria novae-zelandiae CBS 107.79]
HTRTIFQFPKPTWLENIAATRTGHLLVGVLGKPSGPAELHIVDPSTPNTTATLLATFQAADSVFGISEYAPDHFAVAAGNYSPSGGGSTPGSYAVWSVNVGAYLEGTWDAPRVRKIADVPGAQIINGVAALSEKAVLLADSLAGTILRLDIATGKTVTVVEDKSTRFAAPLGVNGLKVSHATAPPKIFYTNSALNATFSAHVDARTGRLVGAVEKVGDVGTPDDLTVADDGAAFVARPYAGTVERVRAGEAAVVVAGSEGSEVVQGATSLALGRGWADRGVVYLGTMG